MFFHYYSHSQFFSRKDIENGKSGTEILYTLVSLQHAVCFSLIARFKTDGGDTFLLPEGNFSGGSWRYKGAGLQAMDPMLFKTASKGLQLGVFCYDIVKNYYTHFLKKIEWGHQAGPPFCNFFVIHPEKREKRKIIHVRLLPNPAQPRN